MSREDWKVSSNGHLILPNGTSYPPENAINDVVSAGNPDFSFVSAAALTDSRLSIDFGKTEDGILYVEVFKRPGFESNFQVDM